MLSKLLMLSAGIVVNKVLVRWEVVMDGPKYEGQKKCSA